MQQHHVGVFAMHPVQHRPDALVVVEVDPAGERDPRPGGQQHLGLCAALGGDEVAAVDHRSGQGAVVHHRSRARAPGRAGVVFEQLGSVLPEKLEGVAPLDQGQPLGDQAFQLDGADFRAVLFLLAAALPVLVAVELALYAVHRAVEEIDLRPEQIGEVGFQARLEKAGDKRVEDVGQRAFQPCGLGQRPRVRLVLAGAMAVELQLVEEAGGRGCGVG